MVSEIGLSDEIHFRGYYINLYLVFLNEFVSHASLQRGIKVNELSERETLYNFFFKVRRNCGRKELKKRKKERISNDELSQKGKGKKNETKETFFWKRIKLEHN